MATDQQAKDNGFALPAPTDPVRNGDDAIRQNARAAVDMFLNLDREVSVIEQQVSLNKGGVAGNRYIAEGADKKAKDAKATAQTALDTANANAAALAGFLVGTGQPEGRVTAPQGSEYRDTAGTAGAWKWRKHSGTGSTGWQACEGDTGALDIDGLLTQGYDESSGIQGLRLARTAPGNVFFTFSIKTTTTMLAGSPLLVIPPGFRPVTYLIGSHSTSDTALRYDVPSGELRWHVTLGPGSYFHLLTAWYTADRWPATLPDAPG